jgi:hypothetical protein
MRSLRYVVWFSRFAIFQLQESPKYLLAKGRDAEAIAVRTAVLAFLFAELTRSYLLLGSRIRCQA